MVESYSQHNTQKVVKRRSSEIPLFKSIKKAVDSESKDLLSDEMTGTRLNSARPNESQQQQVKQIKTGLIQCVDATDQNGRNYQSTCFLKTKHLRFKEFYLSLEGTTVNFSRHTGDQDEIKVRHSTEISGAHIKLGPEEGEQNSHQFYYPIIIMLTANMMQSIYFDSKQTRKKWYV